MGNESAVIKSSEGLDHFHQQFLVKERDRVRNLIFVVDQRSGRQFVMRQLTTNDDMLKKRIEDLVIEKRTRKCKFVMRLEDYHLAQDKRYCLNQFKAYLLFESPHKDLREELLERRLKRTQFHDDQLMSILESVVMGLKYFKDIGHPHEAVCCSNILISREGFIMLSDPWLNVDDTRLPNGDKIYLSPERLQSFNMTRTARVDWYTADLWSLAMVVIEAANLESIEGLYIKNNREVNYDLLRNKLENIKNVTIRKYVEGLLDTQRRRIETANAIEQMIRNKNNNRTEAGYSRVSPHRVNEPVTTTTTTTTTNRSYTPPPAVETVGMYPTKQQEVYVSPTTVLQQQQQGVVGTPPTLMQQQTSTTHEFLQTRPYTNYIEGYQQPHNQLYGQTIPAQPVQPLANKTLYNSSSASNLHAVSPVKQPGQRLVQQSQSPTQPSKHNRSLTVTSKNTQPVAPSVLERQRSNSGFKFNYPTPSAVTTTSAANIVQNPNAASTPSFLNPIAKSRAKPMEYPAGYNSDATSSNWVKQAPQASSLTAINNYQTQVGTGSQSSMGLSGPASNLQPSINQSSYLGTGNSNSLPPNNSATRSINPSKIGSLLSSSPSQDLTYSNTEPANVPSFIKKVPAHGSNTYNASLYGYPASNVYTSSYNPSFQTTKPTEAFPSTSDNDNIFTPSSITALYSKNLQPEAKNGLGSVENSVSSNNSSYTQFPQLQPAGYGATSSSSNNYSSSLASPYSNVPPSALPPQSTGLTTSMPCYTKGLSSADAELFTKPELLKDFTLSTLRNTSSNQTYCAKTNIDLTDLSNFKSSILENNLKQPTPGRVNNFKEVVLSSEHEFKGSNEISPNPADRNYLLEYGGYYGPKPEAIKVQQTESPKPALSLDPLTYSHSSINSMNSPINAIQQGTGSSTSISVPQAEASNSQGTSQGVNSGKAEPQILEIVTKTYTDLKPEDYISKPQNPESQKAEPDHSTPNRRRGPNRNNSTIPEVPESQISMEQELEYVVERYEVGSRYEGYKKNGLRNGRGKFFYQDGGFYDGNWKDDKMHGEGKLYYNETKLAYEGEWYLDEFHGHGKVYNDSPLMLDHPFEYADFDQLDDYWVFYEGNLVADLKEGFGRLKLSNGEIYQGEWKCDRVDGRGRFITIRGEIINGMWRENKLVKVD